jgi:DUF1680 family protein
MTYRAIPPRLDLPADLSFVPGGWVGERLRAVVDNWLLVAPVVDEGMVEMFADSADVTMHGPAWSGEFVGKYLIGAVQALRMGDDPTLGNTVARVAGRLVEIQRSERARGRDGAFIMPLDWDLWGQYHVVLGLLGWHRYSGDPDALRACLAAADETCSRYLGRAEEIAALHPGDDEKNQAVAHVLALLYELTGTQQYLDLVQQIEAEWASDRCFVKEPLGHVRCGDFVENALAGREFFNGTRPRWEALHDVQAIVELHLVTGQPRYLIALRQIWQSLRDHDVNPSGGIGGGEMMTGDPWDPHYVETCATVAWMALTIDLLRVTEDAFVADQLELSLYNAILGAGSPDGRHWTYHTPVGGQAIEQTWHFPEATPEAVRVGYRLPAFLDLGGWQGRARFPRQSCCAANGPRGITCLADWAVLRSADAVAVNFYGESTARFTDPVAGEVRIVQEGDYPVGDKVRLRVEPLSARAADLTVELRIPQWSTHTVVTVNDEPVAATPGSYCRISRSWTAADVVSIEFDFTIRSQPGAREAEGLLAHHRGPLLLAADSRFGWPVPGLPGVEQVGGLRDPQTPVPVVTPRPRVLVPARTSAGPLLLCDFASAGQSPSGDLAPRPETDGAWQFTRVDASGRLVIAPRLTLAPDGGIGGHVHPNESRWGWDDDVLTFFGADGAPTTRFHARMRSGGLHVLVGTFLPDPRIRHELAQLPATFERPWLFSRADRTILKRRVRLLPGGGFDVGMHPNESRWEQTDGVLRFVDAGGRVTTAFDRAEVRNGRMRLTGTFALDPSITHVLDELPADLAGSMWRFDREPHGVFPIADKLRLLPDQRVDGHVHPNETSWAVVDDVLEFRGPTGVATTRFDRIWVEDGLLRMAGRMTDPPHIEHTLVERAAGWQLGGDYAAWLPHSR